MTALLGRRRIGGLSLLHHHPWLVVGVLVIVVAVILWRQRRP